MKPYPIKVFLALGAITYTIILFIACGERNKSANNSSETNGAEIAAATHNGPHIVFVTGDEEYRSEESMPMLAELAQRELDAKVSICYALDENGYIDPNRTDHIEGLEALKTADLMVLFTRFRTLPHHQRKLIANYAESGKPVVGFRTATHAFNYKEDTLAYWNNQWPTKLFGQQWITHHGHFDDGKNPLTKVTAVPGGDHPILRGFQPTEVFSWLYHVEGGEWQLYGDSTPLLLGTSLKSKHAMDGNLDQYPLTNPVAWTKSYTGTSGIKARVFFTTLGHPYDFRLPSIRKIALNGIFWALGKEDNIPDDGTDVMLTSPYEPSNSGFGKRYKKGTRPTQVH